MAKESNMIKKAKKNLKEHSRMANSMRDIEYYMIKMDIDMKVI